MKIGENFIRFLILCFYFYGLIYLWDRFNEPVVYHSYVALNPTLYPGDTVNLELKLTRYRLCATTRDRFIINYLTNEIVLRDRIEGAVNNRLGYDGKIKTEIKLPDKMPSGVYVVRSIVYTKCLFNEFNNVLPEAQINVLDPEKQNGSK